MSAVSSTPSQPSPPSQLRQALLSTAQAYVDGFNSPGPDLAGVVARRASGCMQRILPSTLGVPVQGNDEYVAYSRRIRGVVKNFQLQVVGGAPISSAGEAGCSRVDEGGAIVDEQARRVVLSLRSTGTVELAGGLITREYANEYQVTLRMSEDGEEILEITEFLDSHYTLGLLQLVGMAALAGAPPT